jgi:hypothetical protein
MVIVMVRRGRVGCRVAMRCGEDCCILPLALTIASGYSGGAQRADGARSPPPMPLPSLTPQAQALWDASGMSRYDLAQLLRLAIRLEIEAGCPAAAYLSLSDLARIIHPPIPTLAEAREAARQLAGPEAEIVHGFLASLER